MAMSKFIKLEFLLLFSAFCIIASCSGKSDKNNNQSLELDYIAEKINSKGTLVIEGGGDRIAPILQAIINYGGGVDNAKILVVPFASGIAEQTGIKQSTEFIALGCKNSDYIYCSKDSVDAQSSLKKLEGVTAIFFSGGDQSTLCSFLNGTKFLEKIRDIYKNGGVVSGTSAGAAIMSRVMLTGQSKSDTSSTGNFNYYKANDVVTSNGFAFLDNIVIDQHFVVRSRYTRLLNVLLDNPRLRGIGIDEESAIVVKSDNTIDVVGDGKVIIYEPYKRLENSNTGTSFKLSILSAGDTYKL